MKKATGLAMLLGVLGLMGCTRETAEPPAPVSDEQTLTIGLIPEQDIFQQLRRYEPLAEYVSKRVGAKIELKTLSRYGNILENFRQGHLDGAFFGSFTYVLAHKKLGVEVLARPEDDRGVSTYHGHLIVRNDSGIRTAKDMRGKVFAFVDKATTAGYLFPLAYFKANGIEDYETYFQETYFAGTHNDVILDVAHGKADAGAVKDTVFKRALEKNPELGTQLTVLESSPVVPENGLAVRRDLAAETKLALKQTLLRMNENPEGLGILRAFGARRFIETTDEDYEAVISYAAAVGLDLSRYDYSNE